MSYIPIPVVLEHLTEQLRHHLKDRDPYVRKTAAICVAKLYAADPRKAERGGFVELLRDLLGRQQRYRRRQRRGSVI
jgi:AP-2 complex subunit beta-1